MVQRTQSVDPSKAFRALGQKRRQGHSGLRGRPQTGGRALAHQSLPGCVDRRGASRRQTIIPAGLTPADAIGWSFTRPLISRSGDRQSAVFRCPDKAENRPIAVLRPAGGASPISASPTTRPGEHTLHAGGVVGSIPAAPTIAFLIWPQRRGRRDRPGFCGSTRSSRSRHSTG